MELWILLRCFMLMAMFISVELQQICEPDCTGFYPGELVADPTNCRRFYQCQPDGKPSESPYFCKFGENFNQFDQICGFFPCNQLCESCEFSCLGKFDFIADVLDCSVYYKCDGVGPDAGHRCPEAVPHFDSVRDLCVNDKSVCCNLGCVPYCKDGISNAPDPYNCYNYYDCTTDVPSPIKCLSSVYNIGHASCDPAAECKVWCPAILTSESSATTTTIPGTDEPSTGECLNSYPCTQHGYFAKCPYCDRRYFYCSSPGQQGEELTCPGDYLFNPDPLYPYCFPPGDCLSNPLS